MRKFTYCVEKTRHTSFWIEKFPTAVLGIVNIRNKKSYVGHITARPKRYLASFFAHKV